MGLAHRNVRMMMEKIGGVGALDHSYCYAGAPSGQFVRSCPNYCLHTAAQPTDPIRIHSGDIIPLPL
jgi:hypothetical protein